MLFTEIDIAAMYDGFYCVDENGRKLADKTLVDKNLNQKLVVWKLKSHVTKENKIWVSYINYNKDLTITVFLSKAERVPEQSHGIFLSDTCYLVELYSERAAKAREEAAPQDRKASSFEGNPFAKDLYYKKIEKEKKRKMTMQKLEQQKQEELQQLQAEGKIRLQRTAAWKWEGQRYLAAIQLKKKGKVKGRKSYAVLGESIDIKAQTSELKKAMHWDAAANRKEDGAFDASKRVATRKSLEIVVSSETGEIISDSALIITGVIMLPDSRVSSATSLPQGKEPPMFVELFAGNITLSKDKDVAEMVDSSDGRVEGMVVLSDSVGLDDICKPLDRNIVLHLKTVEDDSSVNRTSLVHGVELGCNTRVLHSTSSYLIISQILCVWKCYAWRGSYSQHSLMAAEESIAHDKKIEACASAVVSWTGKSNLSLNMETVVEGEESGDFWGALGGKQKESSSSSAANKKAGLRHATYGFPQFPTHISRGDGPRYFRCATIDGRLY